jgi:hypothetical protein
LKKRSKEPDEPSTSRDQQDATKKEESPTKQPEADNDKEPEEADIPEEKLDQIAKQCWTKGQTIQKMKLEMANPNPDTFFSPPQLPKWRTRVAKKSSMNSWRTCCCER